MSFLVQVTKSTIVHFTSLDEKNTIQNCGVTLEAKAMQFSTWINVVLWCHRIDMRG